MDLLIQFDADGIERISKRRSTDYLNTFFDLLLLLDLHLIFNINALLIAKSIYKNNGNIEKNDY